MSLADELLADLEEVGNEVDEEEEDAQVTACCRLVNVISNVLLE